MVASVPAVNIQDKSPVQSHPFERNANGRGSVRLREIGVVSRSERNNANNIMTQSMSEDIESLKNGQPLSRVPSAPGSLRYL